ncbi:major facilitator superfamily domain-containing protein [Aspergillus aurantiobrunneus]
MTPLPPAHQWRSSTTVIIACVTIALFSDTFLYGFIVPILGYMLEDRLQIDGSHTQSLTSAILAIHGLIAIFAAPIVGHFADQCSSRKNPLLLSLAGCLAGTVLVACAPSLWSLFLGRTLQGIAGSAVWIVGLATIADAVGEENMGAAMGVVNAFLTGGVIAGPAVSGLLLQAVGYWGTWAAPLVVLTLDIIARATMVERPRSTPSPSSASSSTENECHDSQEGQPLLAGTAAPSETSYQSLKDAQADQRKQQRDLSTSSAFYRAMLTNARVVTALLISVATSSIMTTFDATLPLHVRDVFGWGPSTTGMMFICLEIPAVVAGPLSGRLRDRVGIRMPAALSMAVLAPVFWLLGVPGNDHFPWASANAAGIPIYVACLLAIGTLSPFLCGVAVLELTLVKQQTEQDPNIFGPNGGYSRAYAISDVAAAVAMTLGPTVSGSLRQTVGYYYMNFVFAVVVGGLSIMSYSFLGDRRVKRDDLSE